MVFRVKKIATNRFQVQVKKFFFFWTVFYYGVNEGGGRRYIEMETEDLAWMELDYITRKHPEFRGRKVHFVLTKKRNCKCRHH